MFAISNNPDDLSVKNNSVAIALPLTLGLSLWLLWPAVTGPFIFDDFPNLQNLRELGDHFTRESLGRYLAAWQGSPGRPLAALSFLIEDHAWPTDPEAFKRNNLLWHLLVGLGIFALARKLARLHLSHQGEQTNTRTEWIALAAMTLWLVHPMQLSTTMLVVQRMTIFSNGLIVAGLLIYLWLLDRQRQPASATAALAVGVLGLFGGLAFLAKENGPLIFVYATALNLTLATPLVHRFPAAARRLLWLGTAGMSMLLVLAMLWHVRNPEAAYLTRDFSLGERLLTEARILFDYVSGILLPRMQAGVFFDDYPISRGLLTPSTTLPAMFGVGLAVAAALFGRRRFPLCSFAVLWFAAGHLIESTVIPLELYFEHRNYLAMIGPILAVVIVLVTAPGDLRKPLRAALLAWIGLTAFLGHQAARTWGDELAQAELWAQQRPQSTRAAQTLASALVKLGFHDAAFRVLERARERIPRAGELEFQQALLHCIVGSANPGQFEQLVERARSINWARIIPDVMSTLRSHARPGHCQGALTPDTYRQLTLALVQNPNFQNHSDSIGYLYNELGMLYLELDQPRQALEYLNRSFKAQPDPQLALNEAAIASYLGDLEHASEALQRAENAHRSVVDESLHPLQPRIDRIKALIESRMQEDDESSHPEN